MYKKISAKPILRKSLGRHKIKIKPKKFLHSILNESIPYFFLAVVNLVLWCWQVKKNIVEKMMNNIEAPIR